MQERRRFLRAGGHPANAARPVRRERGPRLVSVNRVVQPPELEICRISRFPKNISRIAPPTRLLLNATSTIANVLWIAGYGSTMRVRAGTADFEVNSMFFAVKEKSMSTVERGQQFCISDAARLIGISPGRLRTMARNEEIDAEKAGPRAWLISASEIERIKKATSKVGRPRKTTT